MPDRMTPLGRPRVVLVAGDPDSTGNLRAAVADHVEVVYAATPADFDDARLRDSGATAALVNLDGGDWLDAVERRLADAGVAIVFNDPETSGKLAGWEQARWLRHLTAKLRGSTDYDPPRPPDDRQVRATAVDADVPLGGVAGPVAASGSATTECPPSLAVAETVAAAPETGASAPPAGEVAVAAIATDTSAARAAADPSDPPTVATPIKESSDMQPPAVAGGTEADAAPPPSPNPADLRSEVRVEAQADEPAPLDLDTAALSAMIDARLAQPDRPASPDSAEVWRVAGDDAAADAQADGAPAVAATAAPATAPVEEQDVLKGLPSVDDWQLVDPEAPVAATQRAPQQSQPEPADAGGLAGLELVPLEASVAVERSIEPIERWMRVDPRERDAHGERSKPAAGAGGDAA